MSTYRIQQQGNLVFSEEAFQFNKSPEVCQDALRKIYEALTLLNQHGTERDYLGKRIKFTKRSGLWELRIKGKSKTEWRFLFKHLSDSEYALLHFFLKKDEKIKERDFAAAERIAEREGW